MRVALDPNGEAIARLDRRDMLALLIHQVVGDADGAFDQNLARTTAHALFFDLTQDVQRHGIIGPDQAGAVARRTWLRRRLQHAGTQTLARHFQQTKARDAANLNTGAVGLELVLQLLLDGEVILALVHVDEVDDDQAREVTQTQLARNLFGGLQIGLGRCVLDRAFLGRPARVHVDGHQRLGHADHDVAAGFQLNRRIEHAAEIGFHLIARKERHRLRVMFHVLGVGRHDHLHEVLGVAIAAFALDQNLVDVARI